MAGSFDPGYVGTNARYTEHLGTINIIPMGARAYFPDLGRFGGVDPKLNGNANAYICPQDPVNGSDLSGEFCLSGVEGYVYESASISNDGPGLPGIHVQAVDQRCRSPWTVLKGAFDSGFAMLTSVAAIVGCGFELCEWYETGSTEWASCQRAASDVVAALTLNAIRTILKSGNSNFDGLYENWIWWVEGAARSSAQNIKILVACGDDREMWIQAILGRGDGYVSIKDFLKVMTNPWDNLC